MKPEAIKKNKERFESRAGRNLTIEKVNYKWTVGDGGGVVIYSDDGKRIQTKGYIVANMTPYDWERAGYKGGAGLTPGMVADWIKKNA